MMMVGYLTISYIDVFWSASVSHELSLNYVATAILLQMYVLFVIKIACITDY